MLINELTVYELKRIITPVIQLQPMSRVCSEIGEVLGIPKADREKIMEQQKFSVRYKGFEVFFSDLRWLSGRGPSMMLQFQRPATKWQTLRNTWFGASHRLMDEVCGEVVQDLKSICLEEMANVTLASTDITMPGSPGNKAFRIRVAYPKGAFNLEWERTNEISPLLIRDHCSPAPCEWFIFLSFNPGAFVRKDGKTVLRENWKEFNNDIARSIDAWVKRSPHFSGHPLTFEEWCENMILDLGDEVAPHLPKIWEEIQSKRGNANLPRPE